MKRTINILNYLPDFMREYKEIKHISAAENPEFERLADISETTMNNQFISSCNEAGISRYEKMLDIQSDNSESLDSRIGRVWSKWIDTIPYTFRALKNKLDIVLGENNHNETIDYENYTISVNINLDISDRIKSINELLDDIIPANMISKSLYDGVCDLEIDTDIDIFEGSLPECGTFECGQQGRWWF